MKAEADSAASRLSFPCGLLLVARTTPYRYRCPTEQKAPPLVLEHTRARRGAVPRTVHCRKQAAGLAGRALQEALALE